MNTPQQNETLKYFKDKAQDWKRRATGTDQARVNVIAERNGFVSLVIENRARTQRVLDVGCGSGDLVCAIAKSGIEAVGVDFSDEMIGIANRQKHQEGLNHAHFLHGSIFDVNLTNQEFDVISANGFIEYISYEELDKFLDLAQRLLSPGGSLVLGSRNRLFNAVSNNVFTLDEIQSGAISLLLNEAVVLSAADGLADLPSIATAPLQSPNTKHPQTGVAVTTRYQFTPAQLCKLIDSHGLTPKELFPIHVHGVPPAFKEKHPDVHTTISNLLHGYAHGSLALVPYASSFMIHATKG